MVLMLILNSKSHMLKTNLDLMKVDISIPNMTDNDDTIRGGQKMALFVDVIKQRSLMEYISNVSKCMTPLDLIHVLII